MRDTKLIHYYIICVCMPCLYETKLPNGITISHILSRCTLIQITMSLHFIKFNLAEIILKSEIEFSFEVIRNVCRLKKQNYKLNKYAVFLGLQQPMDKMKQVSPHSLEGDTGWQMRDMYSECIKDLDK